MHFPEFALFGGAIRCLGRFECILMDGLQRIVQVNVLDLSSLDVLFRDLGERPTDVSSAKRSLVIGELHQGQLGSLIALKRTSAKI
jgi:hypothetical protein